jgi:hypothetical protein
MQVPSATRRNTHFLVVQHRCVNLLLHPALPGLDHGRLGPPHLSSQRMPLPARIDRAAMPGRHVLPPTLAHSPTHFGDKAISNRMICQPKGQW